MILIALGSNLGNRHAQLEAAIAALIGYDIEVLSVSTVMETPALMPENAPPEWNIPFLNQVIAVRTHHDPQALLLCLKHIEQELGRTPRAHWAPREIDLDLLSYNNELIVSDTLTIPHPQLNARRFVLEPIAEIAPQWRHPVFGKTAAELLNELSV